MHTGNDVAFYDSTAPTIRHLNCAVIIEKGQLSTGEASTLCVVVVVSDQVSLTSQTTIDIWQHRKKLYV